MDATITATRADELRKVNDRIHDRWFSVNDIEYRPERRELRISFADDPTLDRRSHDSVRGLGGVGSLVVRHVASYELTDRERIVWYDFNRLRYRERERVLEVVTNIPLHVHLTVSALEVEVASG